FYQHLLTAYSEALLYMMNDTGFMGNTVKIQIQQLQHKKWLYKSPLSKWPYDNATKFKDWLSCLLCDWKLLDLNFNPEDIKPNLIIGRKTPISSFIPTKYRVITNDLR
ncbi:17839_t:CDS:1, partial [Funneliformis geosporum]